MNSRVSSVESTGFCGTLGLSVCFNLGVTHLVTSLPCNLIKSSREDKRLPLDPVLRCVGPEAPSKRRQDDAISNDMCRVVKPRSRWSEDHPRTRTGNVPL